MYNPALENELLPGENILWSGQPSYKKGVLAENMSAITFGLVFILVALPMLVLSILDKRAPAAGIWGPGIFVLAGIHVSVFMPILSVKLRKKTYYAITDQRVIILVVNKNSEKKSFESAFLSDLPPEKCTVRRDGSAMIRLSRGEWRHDNEGDRYLYYLTFKNIEDYETLLQIYRQTKTDAEMKNAKYTGTIPNAIP